MEDSRRIHSETPFLDLDMDPSSFTCYEMKFFLPIPEYLLTRKMSAGLIRYGNRKEDRNEIYRISGSNLNVNETLDGI